MDLVTRYVYGGIFAALLAACGGGGGAANPAGGGTAGISSAGTLALGTQNIGTTGTAASITVTSSGSAALNITGIQVTGPFTTGGNCSGRLAPQATCTLTVAFAPTAGGAVTGLVTIASNVPGPSYTISLSGTGVVASSWTPGQFQPAQNFIARCAVPRTGVNPVTNRPYPDVAGAGIDERNWLRAWTNETYLWFSEVVDRDPGVYSSATDYFDILKTSLTTTSGKPKDKFHFTYPTTTWVALSQSGVSADYGASIVILAGAPPRKAVVAYIEPASPAAAANIARGAQILTVDGVDLVNASSQASVNALNAGLFPAGVGESHAFSILDPGATVARSVTLVSANVTSVPVQNVHAISTVAGPVGYMLFNDHLATSEAALVAAFNTLKTAAVTDLVLDLRYNGGGYLDIASEVAFMIAGPGRTAGQTFEVTQFNSKNPTVDPVTKQAITPVGFHASSLGFTSALAAGQALPTLDLPRVYVLTGPGTCSASESIMNSLRGVNVEVIQIGSTTCGKPYGFYPTDNCGTTYFTIQFQGSNAKGFGSYSDGFSPANTTSNIGVSLPGCSVADDFSHALGDPAEARLAAALSYRTNGACATPATGVARAQAAEGGGYLPPMGDGEVVKSVWQRNRILRGPASQP